MSVFFEHQGLTYELPDGTTPDVAKQKILNHLSTNTKQEPSLIDKIPGLEPQVQQPPDDTSTLGQLTHIGKSLAALPETVAAVGSGMTSGMAGGLLGGWNSMVSGRGFVQGMHEGAEALTYKPRTDIAQEQSKNINEQLNYALAPMMGHMTGFGNDLPRNFKGSNKPTIDPRRPSAPDATGIKETLHKSAIINLESKLNKVKEREKDLEELSLTGVQSKDLQKEQEFLYEQRLKLEANLEHLDSLMGVPKEKTVTSKMTVEEKQKKYDDLKSLANSGVKLSERQIELFDNLGSELDKLYQPKTYGEVFKPLNIQEYLNDLVQFNFDNKFINDPLFRKWLELVNRTRRAEKISHFSEWPKDLPDPYNDMVGFSRARGYSEKEIKDYQEYLKTYDELVKKYGEDVLINADDILHHNIKTHKSVELDVKLNKIHQDYIKKNPQETTLRPLEAPKTEEPIPPPEPPKTNVLDAFKKTSEEHPPGNVNWDRSQEWRSTDTPDPKMWDEYGKIFDETQERNSLENMAKDLPESSGRVVEPKGPKYKLGDPKLGKQLEYQINKLESIRDSLLKQEQAYKDGVTPSGTLDTAKLSERLRWIEDKLDNVLYPLREKHINTSPIKTETKPITTERVKTFNQNVAKQIYKLQQTINKLESQPITEASQKQINRLKDKILFKKQSMDKLEAQLKNQKSSDLPTIDASLLDAQNVSPIEKYSHISDILTAEKHPIDAFINNPELFDTVSGKDTHVDKALVQQVPGIVKTVEAFVKDLGLDADKIYIIEGLKSLIDFQGNSAIIHIDLKTHLTNRDVYMNNPKTRPIVEKLSPENYAHFVTAKVIAHEFGHFVFTKWLKFDNVTNERFTTLIQGFNEWAKKNKIEPISWINSLNRAEYQKYHSYFDEYFAERTADSLIRNTLLDRFSDKRFTIAKQIRSVVDTMTSWLAKQGIKINKFDAVEELIQDIRNRNAEAIKESGKTLWNKLETEQNDKLILTDRDNTYPFANKTLEQIREKPYEVFDVNDTPIPWQNKLGELPDIVNFSSKALEAIGNSGPYLTRKFFGKTTLSGIFKNNPILQDAHYKIRDAEVKSSTAANRIWYTDISFEAWRGAPFLQRFSKVKLPDAPIMVWKALTNQEAYRLHEVYKQGRENNLSHRESLEQFGQHLTEKEKNAYTVFGKMFDDAHAENLKLEMKLGKKDRLKYLPGYYPSVRRGDYFVTINMGEHVAHRQHFNTKVAAEAWIKKVEPELGNTFELGPLEKVSDGAQHPGTFEMIDVADNYLENKGIDVHEHLLDLKQKLATRGGKFGHHNEERFNIAGYKGSELGLTPEELGHSFKQGIRDYVQEFQSQYKSMLIRHEVDPMLNAMDLKDTHPQTHAAIQQMRDSALNIVPNNVKAFDTAVYESSDRVARFFYNLAYPNKLFSPHDPIYKTAQAAAISTFYLFKVLPSLAMSVVQLLNPVIAMRHGAIDNGLLTMGSFAKGMYKLFSGDAELLRSLHEITQTTDIIEPQFLNTLHLKGENKLLEGLKDWGAMRKPQEACDIISRTMGYAYFYTHYKDIGHTSLEAKTLAMEAIDSNFGAYTRGESAPIFQHLGGIIGEGMRPLQTFGQMTVGNLIADIKRMTDTPGQLKSYAPFIMYGLTATLLGGAVTGPIMNMYETLRQSFMKLWPEMNLPSALDLVLKGVLSLDSIVEDKEALAKLTAYGVLSQQTGIDIGASARTTETLPGTMLSILLAVVEGDKAANEIAKELGRLMPVHSNVVHMTSGAYTLGKSIVKDVPKNELKQAITDFSMRGPMKNALMEATGANKTTVMGKDTNMIASGSDSSALMKEGPKEKMAHWMGNMSTEERFRTDQKIEAEFTNKVYNDKIKRMFILYNQTLKPQYLDKLIELGATDANIKSQLETRTQKALLPADIREITNNKGKVLNNLSSVRKLEHQGLFNFRRQ